MKAQILFPVVMLAGLSGVPSGSAQDERRADADFRIAFWYAPKDLKGSFRYQIYDLRRNEFPTKAVTEWLSETNNSMRGTKAYLKDVCLQSGTDRSEREQLQVIIDAERTAINEGFLGLADDASRRIGDEAPRSPARNITRITAVKTVTYEEYLQKKQHTIFSAQEIRDGFVYFATVHIVHVPLGNGTRGHGHGSVSTTERYRAKLPSKPK